MIRAITFASIVLLTYLSLAFLFPLEFLRSAICVAVFLVGNLSIAYLILHPRSQLLVPNRSRVDCNEGPCVALTFDDGPTKAHTVKLLDILRNMGVNAVFFVVGQRAEQCPDLLNRICEEGHLIANHTYSHPSLFCFLTPRRLGREIRDGQKAIQEICSFKPRYFRSPVGLKHPLLSFYLRANRLEFLSWRVRAFDTFPQPPEMLVKRIIKNVSSGDIILLHDKPGIAGERMLKALPDLIERLSIKGFRFVLP